MSSHPLLFSNIRAALSGCDFDVSEFRVTPRIAPDPKVAVPQASIYVIDALVDPSSTVETVDRISNRFPLARVIVIAENFDVGNSFPLLRHKVKGLVRYEEVAAHLARAVEAVRNGGFWVPRPILSGFVEATIAASTPKTIPGGPKLTSREREVLDGLIEKLSNKEIAKKLAITDRGVKFHVSNLLVKHRVNRRADLILLYLTAH